MQNLRALRKARNLSGAKLAALVGVNDRRLRRWESLEVEPPREFRIALANALDVTLDELEGRTPAPAAS